jgi:hypothetical protein
METALAVGAVVVSLVLIFGKILPPLPSTKDRKSLYRWVCRSGAIIVAFAVVMALTVFVAGVGGSAISKVLNQWSDSREARRTFLEACVRAQSATARPAEAERACVKEWDDRQSDDRVKEKYGLK